MKKPVYIFIAGVMMFFSCNSEEKDLARTLSEDNLQAYIEKRTDGTTYYKIIKSLVLFGSADRMAALAWDD